MINKLPIEDLRNQLTALAGNTNISSSITKISKSVKQFASTQNTVLGREFGEVIGGVQSLTQEDEFPATDNVQSSVAPMATLTSAAQSSLTKTLSDTTGASAITNSSNAANGFLEATLLLGSPQSIKNAVAKSSGVDLEAGALLSFVPENLQDVAGDALGQLNTGQDFSKQFASLNLNIPSAVSEITTSLNDFLGNIGNGIIGKSLLSKSNIYKELLNNITNGGLTEEELDTGVNLFLENKNSEVIDLVASKPTTQLGPVDLDNIISDVNSSVSSNIDFSSLETGFKSSRFQRDLSGTDFGVRRGAGPLQIFGSGTEGASSPNVGDFSSYTFEEVGSVEELIAELKGITRPITETVVHWTAHYNNQPYVGSEQLHEIALQTGSSRGCSYHYIIKQNGVLQRGRPVNIIGEHAKASGHNRFSIGVSMVGGYNCPVGTSNPDRYISVESLNLAQFKALDKYFRAFFIVFPGAQAFGHMDFDPSKSDPGFDVGGYIKTKFNKSNVKSPTEGPASLAEIAILRGEQTEGENVEPYDPATAGPF